MSQSYKTTVETGLLHSNDLTVNSGKVNQATSITTSVILPSKFGVIVTQGATAATNGSNIFTATHPQLTANKVVLASIVNYAGAGSPSVYVSTTTGSMSVVIRNNNDIAALNAPLTIAYAIF